jgi:hypothetical protein
MDIPAMSSHRSAVSIEDKKTIGPVVREAASDGAAKHAPGGFAPVGPIVAAIVLDVLGGRRGEMSILKGLAHRARCFSDAAPRTDRARCRNA